MFCRKCGKAIPDDSVFCPHCGEKSESDVRPGFMGLAIVDDEPQPVRYAGFWLRFWAYLIDGILLSLVLTPTQYFMGVPMFNFDTPPVMDFHYLKLVWGSSFLTWVISMLYFALMESSSKQATIGKIICGIYVTDEKGEPIGFGKALLRNISKLISGAIILIGYMMAGFTKKKQALHDMLAECLVVRK